MHIIVNGKNKELTAADTLATLITQFCQDARYVVAELNGQIVKKPDWAKAALNDGDQVELVSLVGGG